MFQDNFVVFRYNHQSKLNGSVSRINPFTNDSKEEPPSLSLPQKSLSDSLIVSNHFEQPSSVNEKSSIEDLTKAVRECKLSVLKLMDNEEAKNRQIKQLIKLNETLHTVKEVQKYRDVRQRDDIVERSPVNGRGDIVPIDLAGHRLVRTRAGVVRQKCCEVCQRPVRAARTAYNCCECSIYLHSSPTCVARMHRACPASNIGHPSLFPSQTISGLRYSSADNDLYIDIETFPLAGSLVSQNFLCGECNQPISPAPSSNNGNSPRSPSMFCNYFRRYYCPSCHWGNRFWIPSVFFMLDKWTKLPVCRTAYLKLKYMWNLVLFRIPIFWEQHNSNAHDVLAVRLKMFRLRAFITHCDSLKHLTLPYEDWLIEQPYLVSMQFVQNISNGSALKSVQILYSTLIDHISDCESCKSMGRPCSLCDDPQVLYPRPGSTWSCSKCCFAIVHESCGVKNGRMELEYICDYCSQA